MRLRPRARRPKFGGQDGLRRCGKRRNATRPRQWRRVGRLRSVWQVREMPSVRNRFFSCPCGLRASPCTAARFSHTSSLQILRCLPCDTFNFPLFAHKQSLDFTMLAVRHFQFPTRGLRHDRGRFPLFVAMPPLSHEPFDRGMQHRVLVELDNALIPGAMRDFLVQLDLDVFLGGAYHDAKIAAELFF